MYIETHIDIYDDIIIQPRLGFKKSINVNPSNRELSAQRTNKRKRYIHIHLPF